METKFRKGGVGYNVTIPVAEGLRATGSYTPGTNSAPGIIPGSLNFDPLADEIGDVPGPKYGASITLNWTTIPKNMAVDLFLRTILEYPLERLQWAIT